MGAREARRPHPLQGDPTRPNPLQGANLVPASILPCLRDPLATSPPSHCAPWRAELRSMGSAAWHVHQVGLVMCNHATNCLRVGRGTACAVLRVRSLCAGARSSEQSRWHPGTPVIACSGLWLWTCRSLSDRYYRGPIQRTTTLPSIDRPDAGTTGEKGPPRARNEKVPFPFGASGAGLARSG